MPDEIAEVPVVSVPKVATANLKGESKKISSVLQISTIALDTYDDLFSDFDPSPYDSRILSEDLIKELNRRHTETPKGDIIVKFTIPAPLRSEKIENVCRRRIRDYFKARLKSVDRSISDIRRNGIIRVLFGIIIELFVFSTLTFDNPVALSFFSVFSWYAIWSGLERLFEIPMRLATEKQFAEKFTKAEYKFVDQEAIVQSIASSLQAYL